jgi:AmmeMemoRadiSam system protein A
MDELTAEERTRLLRLARASIRRALGEDDEVEGLIATAPPTPAMKQHAGAFVTLRTVAETADPAEKLRGCIGCMEPDRRLDRRIVDLAAKAALHDPRFPPLTSAELARTRIEISVLGRSEPLGDPAGLLPGRDGVELKKGAAHAVFLPHVATEHGWDRDTLLRQLSRKAGLAEDAWRDAELSVFRSLSFAEPRPPDPA